MKKHQILLVFLCIFSISFAFSQEKQLTEAETPSEIKTYVTKHFSNEKIVFAEQDRDFLSKKYTVKLNNGVEIDFDDDFQPYKIESDNGLPNSVIPNSIVQYVSKNFPSEKIKEWKKERNKQKIELINGIDLEFDKNGNFIRID